MKQPALRSEPPVSSSTSAGVEIAPDLNAPLPELNLLREWREPLTFRHFLWLALGSLLIHAGAVAFFFSLPEVVPQTRAPIVTADLRKAVHLVTPKLFEPTQKAPNLNKVVHPELDVRSSIEAPQTQQPKFRPPAPVPGRVIPTPPPSAPPVIEPPKIQADAAPAPPMATPMPSIPDGTGPAAPPTSAKPKMAFENVGSSTPVRANSAPNPAFQIPKSSVEDTMRATPRSGGGGVTVGDIGDDASSLLGSAPSKGAMGSNLQLLSDPTGVDFKPYLIQVLMAVRRNWMAVLPESAHMGRRGQVLIQFIIDREGRVPKLVIASPSGTEAFDRAAVAGVSASYPFPRLPSEFKGDQIRLQLAFTYNGRGK